MRPKSTRPRTPLLSLVILVSLLSGCGGRATVDGRAAPDAAGVDAAPDASGLADAHQDSATGPADAIADGTSTDAAPTAFCDGSAKALWQGTFVEPVDVTTGLVVMDCCDGFTVRWHATETLGFDALLTLRTMGLMEPGTYDLSEADGPSVSVTKTGGTSGDEQALEGSLTIQQPGGPNEPAHVGVCVSVTDPGDPLEGLRLYVPDVVVASWSQQELWTLHLLSDESISAVEALALPLDSLALDPALVNLLQVAYYDANDRTIVWDSWGSTSMIVNQLPAVGVEGVPFVVRADGQSIFVGAFMTAMSSMSFQGPTVTVETTVDDRLVLEPGYPGGPPPDPDPRDDPRILKAFEASGKLVP